MFTHGSILNHVTFDYVRGFLKFNVTALELHVTDTINEQLARLLERESANFGFWLFLAKLTPAIPNLVEKRRKNQFWPYLGLEETILDEFLVDFGSLRPSRAIGAGFRAI
jgi:hypothetical protein